MYTVACVPPPFPVWDGLGNPATMKVVPQASGMQIKYPTLHL